ncbi:MAG TPA: GspH/FimT family pseudopilin [Tepidisphaeraceae bacterium]|nr:GspH/FimT family pseudopilin [Tepidisphaeraceae bacterium]
MKPRRAQSAGFTLLELVLVMVVFCTVMSIAAPSLRGFWGASETNNAAAQFLALTQWARSAAVTEGCLCRLNVDRATGEYWLTQQQDEQFVSLGSEFGRIFSIPDEHRIELVRPDGSNADWITFHPSGRLEPVTVRITDRRGQEIQITSLSPTEPFHIVEDQETHR